MIQYTELDQPDRWLLWEPMEHDSIRTQHTVATRFDRSQIGNENRRLLAPAMRTSLTGTVWLTDGTLRAFALAAQRYAAEEIWVPLWPAAVRFPARASSPLTTGRWFFSNTLDPEDCFLANTLDPAGFAGDEDWVVMPALLGKLTEPLAIQLRTDTLGAVSISIEEASYDFRLRAITSSIPVGPVAFGAARPLFDAMQSFEPEPQLVREIDVVTNRIGYGHGREDSYEPQFPRRAATGAYTLRSLEAAVAFLAFFDSVGGNHRSFWIPLHKAEARLRTTAVVGSLTLDVDSTATLGSNAFLALGDADDWSPVKIASAAGNTVALTDPLERTFHYSTCRVTGLMLGRFQSGTVDVEWDVTTASIAVRFVECPAEYIGIGTEGVDSGAMIQTAFGYEFGVTQPNGSIFSYARYTSHATSLTIEGETFTPASINHNQLAAGLNLEDSSLDLTMTAAAGSPGVSILTGAAQSLLRLKVYEIALGAAGVPTSRVLRFSGSVTNARSDDPVITLTASSADSLGQRSVANSTVMPECNWSVYGRPCGLILSDWMFDATIFVRPATTSFSVEIAIAAPGAGHLPAAIAAGSAAIFPHYFAGGWLELIAPTGETLLRSIHDSGTFNGTTRRVTLTLDGPLLYDAGTEVRLWPFCDNQRTTCKAYHATTNPTGKFNNYTRFGGFPWAPAGNPSLAQVVKSSGRGGKK